jgi:hypothetical protein
MRIARGVKVPDARVCVTKAVKLVETQPRFGCLLDYCETPHQRLVTPKPNFGFTHSKPAMTRPANQTTRTEQWKLNPRISIGAGLKEGGGNANERCNHVLLWRAGE